MQRGGSAYPNGESGIKVVHGSSGPRPLDGHCPSLAAIKSLLARKSSLTSQGLEPEGHACGTGGRGLRGGSEDARKHNCRGSGIR